MVFWIFNNNRRFYFHKISASEATFRIIKLSDDYYHVVKYENNCAYLQFKPICRLWVEGYVQSFLSWLFDSNEIRLKN